MTPLVAVLLLIVAVGGCHDGRADIDTLDVAESFTIADTKLESATRMERVAIAGRPNSGFPSYASILQTNEPGRNPNVVRDELRQRAVEDGWTIDEVDDDGGFRTANRTVDGRAFKVRTGFNPETNEVLLWLDQIAPETLP